MTVTLDNKKIYEETDDNVELSVWDNRLSSRMIVYFWSFFSVENYFLGYLGIKLRKIKTTKIFMSEVFYESISGKKSDLLLTKYSSLIEIFCAENFYIENMQRLYLIIEVVIIVKCKNK